MPSEESDQPGHPHRLIRVLAVCSEVSGMMCGCDQRETTHHSYYDRIIDNYLSCLASAASFTIDIRYRLRGCAFVVGQNKLLMTLMKCYILISQSATQQWAAIGPTCFTQRPDMGCRQRPFGAYATRQLVGPTYSKKRWAVVQSLSILNIFLHVDWPQSLMSIF